MDAPKASCRSRNLAADGPMLPHGGRTAGESVHDSHALASDGSNTSLAMMLNSHAISPGNMTAAVIKLNPTLPRNVSTSVIQSSWIQRLKPFSQSNTSKEEPANFSTKENPVCTHFTKDFSSSSRRLNKSSHHTRSSSWPTHALQLQGVEHSPMELGEPADITEGYGKAVVNSLDINHQSIQIPSNNITHSSDASSRTGNLFAQQQISCKQASAVEGFVPYALNRENPTLKKLNDLQEIESGGDSKPKECLAQKFLNSIEDVKKVNSVGECNVALQMKALVQTEEAEKNWDYSYGSRGASKGDIHAPVLSVSAYRAAHSSGASADADDNIFFAKSLNCCMGNKMLPVQTSFLKPDCEIAFSTAVVSENRVNVDKAGEDWRFGMEAARTGLKDAGNLGFTRTVSNFKQFKEAVVKPYLLNNFSNVGASSKFHLSPRNSHLSKAFNNANERDVMTTCAVGSRMVAASASLKKDDVSKRSGDFFSKENNLADLQNPHYSEGGRTSRSTLPVESLHEDAERSRIREISLGEYWNSWVRLLEKPVNVKPAQAGSPTASSQQDYVVGEYHKNLFRPPLSKARLDARQKFEGYRSCSPHKHLNDDAENFGSCDLPRMLTSSSKNYKFLESSSQTKTGWGQDCSASADQSSHFSLKGLQESQKHDLCFYTGATGRVDSQLHNEDSGVDRRFLDDCSSHSRMHSTHPLQEVCYNERTGEGSCMHQVWIRRWQPSAKFSAVAGKASLHVPYFSRSLSSDQLVKSCSASAQCPLISSHKAMGSFDHNLTDSGRGSTRYTEASGTRLDSGSASTTPGSFLAGRNFAAFRSGYTGSCVETMAIVGQSSSKLSPTSLQNRGFCGLPCISPKFVKCIVLPEDEKMHLLDSDDLKALERHIHDS